MKGIPATGKHLEWYEAYFVKFENGKMGDMQFIVDNYGRLKQLGVYE